MAIKTVCVLFVAVAIASTLATGTGNSVPSTNPDATPSDNVQSGVANLRSGRQLLGYPGGFGGGNAFSSASAFSGGNGFGYPYGGGLSAAQASASAGSFGK